MSPLHHTSIDRTARSPKSKMERDIRPEDADRCIRSCRDEGCLLIDAWRPELGDARVKSATRAWAIRVESASICSLTAGSEQIAGCRSIVIGEDIMEYHVKLAVPGAKQEPGAFAPSPR